MLRFHQVDILPRGAHDWTVSCACWSSRPLGLAYSRHAFSYEHAVQTARRHLTWWRRGEIADHNRNEVPRRQPA